MTPIFRGGSTGAAKLGHASGQSPTRRKQEVARATGGIEDREIQESLYCPARVLIDRSLNDGLKRAVEQQLDKAVWGVIAARSLARVALRLSPFGKEEDRASRSTRGVSSNSAS